MRALQIAGFIFSIILLGLMFTMNRLFDHFFVLNIYCQLYTRSHEACFYLHHLIVWLEDNPPDEFSRHEHSYLESTLWPFIHHFTTIAEKNQRHLVKFCQILPSDEVRWMLTGPERGQSHWNNSCNQRWQMLLQSKGSNTTYRWRQPLWKFGVFKT